MVLFHRSRIMIAGERSGVGKSTITIGIISALRARGLDVQPFKTGPDFLDPMHHDAVSIRRSRNLDTWMFPGFVKESFLRNSEHADISVLEGVMGLYDGYDGLSEEGSSAHLAKTLDCPVVLVLNAESSARSLGAVAHGFRTYDPDVKIAGVIFNNIGSKKHLDMVTASLRGVECFGGLPKIEEVGLKSRHLGLVPAAEDDNTSRYESIRKMLEENLDIDRMIEIANRADDLDVEAPLELPPFHGRCRIGVAMDAAFNFYYQDNFDILRRYGAEIVHFSPLSDQLPDVDGVYLGGGYPELFADRLSENYPLLRRLSYRAFNGMPLYAECGGLMYLCKSMRDLDGKDHPMSAIFDAKVEMTGRLMALGYVNASTIRDNVLSRKGDTARGHVFHYSHITECNETDFAYKLDKDKGIKDSYDGMIMKNTMASYTHLHFGCCLKHAQRFVDKCVEHARK